MADDFKKIIKQVQKSFGEDSVMLMSDPSIAEIETIPTGSYLLDKAIGAGGIPRGRITEIYGQPDSGKAVSIDTPILTPDGFKLMGDIKVGDTVYSIDGSKAKVTFVTEPMYNHKVYRVLFSNGEMIKADEDHIWSLKTQGKKLHNFTTRELYGLSNKIQSYFLPNISPINFEKKDQEYDPYLFGYFYGGKDDRKKIFNKENIRKYLFGDIDQRKFLLCGILDSRGKIDDNGNISITTYSSDIVQDILFLLNGLGIRSELTVRAKKTYKNKKATIRAKMTIHFSVEKDFLPYKINNLEYVYKKTSKIYIDRIEETESVPVKCIQVDHPSHLYLVGETLIPTHNTTLALSVATSVQKMGGDIVYLDVEQNMNTQRASEIGLDLNKVAFSQPDTAEQCWNICETFIRSGVVDLVVIDSIAAMPPSVEISNDFGASNMGVAARLNSQAMRKLAAIINKTKTALLLINQIRKTFVMYGNPNISSGGEAIKFHASLRLEMSRIGPAENGKPTHHKVKIVKNKIGRPFGVVEFDVNEKGIDSMGEIIDLAISQKVLEQSGAWIKYKGESFAQGKEKAREIISGQPQLLEEIKSQVQL